MRKERARGRNSVRNCRLVWLGKTAKEGVTYPAELKHAFEASHNHSLEVQLCGDAQCEGLAQGVVVGHKGPRVSTTSNSLKHRRLNLT